MRERTNVPEDARAGEPASSVGRLLALLLSAFGIFGLWSGCNAVLLTDLSRTLGVSPGPLGIALFAGAGASMATMGSLGWTADRLGRKVFIVVVAGVFGLGISGLALAGSFAALVVVLMVLFSATGLYDVGINAAAVDLERFSGRRFMSFLHAAYSAGAVAGAIAAGALLSTGAGYRLVYLALLIPLGAVVAAFVAARLPNPDDASGAENLATIEGTAGEDGTGRWDPYRSAPLLLVAAIATLGMLAEGQMGNWSGIYLRDSLGLSALVGGSGVAVFYGAMALGRVGTGWVVGRLGSRATLLGAGLLAASGMALALATTLPALVVGGFFVVGVAISGVVPMAFSLAGDLVPHRAGTAISVVTTFGYAGFLLGPPLIGGLAELAGLRTALGTIALASLTIFVLSLSLRKTA